MSPVSSLSSPSIPSACTASPLVSSHRRIMGLHPTAAAGSWLSAAAVARPRPRGLNARRVGSRSYGRRRHGRAGCRCDRGRFSLSVSLCRIFSPSYAKRVKPFVSFPIGFSRGDGGGRPDDADITIYVDYYYFFFLKVFFFFCFPVYAR